MKNLFIQSAKMIATLVFVATLASGQQWKYLRSAGGSSSEMSRKMTTDKNGNTYSIGDFNGNSTFGSFNVTSLGQTDIFVSKCDANGSVSWLVQFGGSNYDYGYGVAVDVDGNVFVTGGFNGTANFGDYQLTSSGSSDIFVAKLNAAGSVLWAKKAGGRSADLGTSCAIDASGNVVVVGAFYSTVSCEANQLKSCGGSDVFLAKYTSTGDLLFVESAGGKGADRANDVVIDASDNIIFGGSFQQQASFGGLLVTSAGNSDAFVAKYAANGNPTWVSAGGSANYDYASSVAFTPQGEIYVTGNYSNSFTWNGLTANADTIADGYLAKLSASGVAQWINTFEGVGGMVNVASVASDPVGNAVVGGTFEATLNFSDSVFTTLGQDAFVAKYDAKGQINFALKSSSDLITNLSGVAIDFNGKVYVFGSYYQSTQFGSYNANAIGTFDVFVAGYDAVCVPPSIITQPQNVSSCPNLSATLSVEMLGDGLDYNWFKNGSPVGVNNYALNFASLTNTDSANYYCVITGLCGEVTTDTITLSVYPSSNIEPIANQQLYLGQNIDIPSDASGKNLNYKWLKGTTFVSSKTTLNIRNFLPSAVNVYSCVVTGTCGTDTATFNLSLNTTVSRIGHGNAEKACDIAHDVDGNQYIVGNFSTSTHILDTSLTGTMTDAFILKTDVNGNRALLKLVNGANNEDIKSVKISGDYLLITGIAQSGTTINGQPLNLYGNNDAFVAAFNRTTGTLLWIKTMGGTASDYATDMAIIDGGQSVVIVGQYASTNFTADAFTLPYDGGIDVFVAKLNITSGTITTLTRICDSDPQIKPFVAYSNQKLLVAGSYMGRVKSGSYTSSKIYRGWDIFVATFDTNLNAIGLITAASTGEDVVSGITPYNGDFYLSGSCANGIKFGSLPAANTVNASIDAYVAKISFNPSPYFAAYTTYGSDQRDVAYNTAIYHDSLFFVGSLNTSGVMVKNNLDLTTGNTLIYSLNSNSGINMIYALSTYNDYLYFLSQVVGQSLVSSSIPFMSAGYSDVLYGRYGNPMEGGRLSQFGPDFMADTYTPQSNEVEAYPNPSNGLFTIASQGFTQLAIFDLSGRQLTTQTIDNNLTQIDMQGKLQPGIYILKLANQTQHKSIKILIE